MLPRSLLALALLAALPLALLACAEEEETEIVIPEEPSDISDPDLLGYWALLRVNDGIPEGAPQLRYQFTAQGEMIQYEDDVVTRATFTYAGPSQITVNDPAGTRFYEYEITGDELTLSETGEDGESVTLTRLADVDLEDVAPPEPSTNIPEDSVPADSMARDSVPG